MMSPDSSSIVSSSSQSPRSMYSSQLQTRRTTSSSEPLPLAAKAPIGAQKTAPAAKMTADTAASTPAVLLVVIVFMARSFLPHGSYVHAHHDQDDDREDHGGEGPERCLDRRLGALGRVDDISADGVEHRGLRVHRDKIVIQRKRDRQRETGDDPGYDLRDHDLPLHRCSNPSV